MAAGAAALALKYGLSPHGRIFIETSVRGLGRRYGELIEVKRRKLGSNLVRLFSWVAYEMNGQPLPMLNGFPARLIVPGWYATYWVKNLSEITILDKSFDGYWMTKAYLIPDTPCGCIEPGSTPARTAPISRMDVRSLIVSPGSGERLAAGKAVLIKGIAFDAGSGIRDVTVSTNNGATWRSAKLEKDLGDYSFREWSIEWKPPAKGVYTLMARATNRMGESQPLEPRWNPAGYLRNVVERTKLTVS
jgi:sulfite dehydrogenase (cytochrome) subunit A